MRSPAWVQSQILPDSILAAYFPAKAYIASISGARRGEGQTRFGEFIDTIPARSLPSVITELLRDYAANRQGHELLPDYYDRMGKSYFQTRVRLD